MNNEELNNEDLPPRTSITIDGALRKALDEALEHERSQGNKYLKNINQLAVKWLWERLKQELPRRTGT